MSKIDFNKNLNFLYCFDNNYYKQSYTAIFSLLENVDKKINIHIIHNKVLTLGDLPNRISGHKNLNYFQNYIFKDYNYFFPNLNEAHLTEATYYRLFLENYLSNEINSIIYLDGDTVCINNPIKTLENQIDELTNSQYIISAKTEYKFSDNPNHESFARLDIDDKYFNAGVMIIDFKKWVLQNYTDQLIFHMKKIEKNILNWDQDVMNSIINGSYIELDSSLNINANKNEYKQSDFSRLMILHYIGSKKPWLTSGILQFPLSSNYYQKYFLNIFGNFHIEHKWKRASLIQYLVSVFNFKLFKLDKPLIYTKELLKSIFLVN